MSFETNKNSLKNNFNRHGPWALVAIVVAVAVIYEIGKHHSLNTVDVMSFVGLIIAVVFHEAAHGLVAYWCGDDTAKVAKRITLNPIRHIDILGSIIVPIVLILTVGIPFGWAKPVPVSINKLRHPRNQAVLVSFAGPVINILLALVAGFLFKEVLTPQLLNTPIDNLPIQYMFLFLFGEVNVLVACFNLIPIPPLDGSAILERIIPKEMLPQYYKLRMMSMVFVFILVLLLPSVVDSISIHALTYWADIVGLR